MPNKTDNVPKNTNQIFCNSIGSRMQPDANAIMNANSIANMNAVRLDFVPLHHFNAWENFDGLWV